MRRNERLDAMRLAVEAAVGSMRQVAQHLEEIADALPRRESTRRLLLHQQADRLNAAANLLTTEAAAGEVSNVSRVARVSGVVLVTVGTVLGTGAAEGISAVLAERAFEWRLRAEACIQEVAHRADDIEAERDTFDVVLVASGNKKIQVIKEIRQLTNMGLKEAKDLVDSAPNTVLRGVTTEDATKAQAQLERVGAKVEIH